ncbi:MAG: histidine kinase [Bacteroidetes bacterium]|nr:histidine kinase [Bacteroidota bacterium]
MDKRFFNKYLIIIIPLVGSLIVGVYLISYGINDYSKSVQYLIHGLVITSGLWLGCMSIVMLLWKKFPWEQSPFLHLILEIILITVYTLVFSSSLYFLETKFWNIHEVDNLGMEVFTTVLITYLITSVHESVFFYSQWKYNFSKSVRLEKDNIEAKYEALRAQINPHFLFNSLNSLTTMVEDNKPVVDYIQSLSELLRYMLKSGEKELVLLREEVSIMNSYIRLQKMRFPETLNIKVDISESFYHFAVPPLALQMLVENSIKHNIISKDKPLIVQIIASGESISVINNLQRKSGVDSTGQGLINITGRYRFFTTRKVEINETSDKFSVTIPLLQVEL